MRRNPLFRPFLFSYSISLLGTNIFDIAIPLYVLQRTHSAYALSMVAFCLHLPYFIMAPLTGYLADAFDKRKVMLYTDIGQVLCLALLLIYYLSSHTALWPILIVVFLAKTLMNLFETVTSFQLIPRMVAREDLTAANGVFLTTYRFVQVLGPLFAGVLLSVAGVGTCIVIDMLSFGATLYFTSTLLPLKGECWNHGISSNPNLKDLVTNFRESLDFVRRSAIFKPFTALMFFWNLSSFVPNSPSLVYYFTETHHYSSAQYGLIAAFISGAGVIGYLLSGRLFDSNQLGFSMIRAAYFQGLMATAALLFFKLPLGVALCFGIARIGSSLLTMGTFWLRQTKIPLERMGGVNSCVRMFFMSSAPISVIIQAYLITRFGVLSSLCLGALCLWAVYYFGKKVSTSLEKDEQPALDAAA